MLRHRSEDIWKTSLGEILRPVGLDINLLGLSFLSTIWKLAQACTDWEQAIKAVQKRIPKGEKVRVRHFEETTEALLKQTKNAKRPREGDNDETAKRVKKTEPGKSPHGISKIG